MNENKMTILTIRSTLLKNSCESLSAWVPLLTSFSPDVASMPSFPHSSFRGECSGPDGVFGLWK